MTTVLQCEASLTKVADARKLSCGQLRPLDFEPKGYALGVYQIGEV